MRRRVGDAAWFLGRSGVVRNGSFRVGIEVPRNVSGKIKMLSSRILLGDSITVAYGFVAKVFGGWCTLQLEQAFRCS